MPLTLHHRPSSPGRQYVLHSWIDRGPTWDLAGTSAGGLVTFLVPVEAADLRALQFDLSFALIRR